MLISEKMNSAINQQIGNEFLASLQYVSIAAWFSSESLPQLAAHFFQQSKEEREHALKFAKYVLDAGGRVRIPAIAEPKSQFSSAEEAVRHALEHEKLVTRQINDLVDLGMKENDHLTQSFLQWFVTEQLEEVSSMDTLLKIVQRAGEKGLLHVEEYLARSKSGTEKTPPAAP